MTRLLGVNRGMLTVLSIATGAVKLARMQDEVDLFAKAGMGESTMVAFGALQLLGGIALIPRVSTRAAAWVMAATFVIASAVVFKAGMPAFGFVSLAFIAMAIVHARTVGQATTPDAMSSR